MSSNNGFEKYCKKAVEVSEICSASETNNNLQNKFEENDVLTGNPSKIVVKNIPADWDEVFI